MEQYDELLNAITYTFQFSLFLALDINEDGL